MAYTHDTKTSMSHTVSTLAASEPVAYRLVKQLFDASQIEFLLHALQVRLRGLFDLVIIFEPRSCSAGCSNKHLIGIVVILTLLNRPSTQCLPSFSSSEEVVPR